MMFNGLLMFGDSDNSDVTKDSGGPSSLVDSATGSCDANTRANYYHNKLLSTLQILQNKEETIRVQAESLAVAEGRISSLTDRALELRRELERKTKEIQTLRKSLERCRVEKVDVSITADTEAEHQTDIVNTLQNNLTVIEDLYRECFYETAKQESLIEMLRKSYLDVRVMDKQKAEHIGRLQNVINTQKWSLDRCQDIALEVDNLKMEICNFLSSSTSTNNDSGMWERSEESFASAPGVSEDLQDIMEQLLKLRGLLTSGCICGLEEENKRLKIENQALEREIVEICESRGALEVTLATKDDYVKKYKQEIETKDKELTNLKEELEKLSQGSRDNNNTFEMLSLQLQQTQVLLSDKNEELVKMQQELDLRQETINELRQELQKAERICKENCRIRGELSYLTGQVAQWRVTLAESERRVRMLDAKLRQAQACYREKEHNVSELQSQLEEAHARGAALCADARRALCAVRHWAKRVRDRNREQENIIKEKNLHLSCLQRRLDELSNSTQSTNDNRPTCSKCLPQPACCPKVQASQSRYCAAPSELASCSSAPTPPRRLLRKKPCSDRERSASSPWSYDASVQEPVRRDVSVVTSASFCDTRNTRGISPTDELFSRVERLSDALQDGYRRWARHEPR